MKPTSEEYFYFEWLIIEKKMTSEMYESLNENEIYNLIKEYNIFKKRHQRYQL